MPEESLRAWVELFASSAPRPAPSVIEVGAGTGVSSAGFVLEGVGSFATPVTASLGAYHARLVTRPQSKFTHLTAEEFHEGLVRMEAAARDEARDGPRPVVERYDVAVFVRG